METLLQSIGSNSDIATGSTTETTNKRRKNDKKPEKASGKVERYHGSSSGYYLVSDILSNNTEDDLKSNEGSNNQQHQRAYVLPSLNGGQDYRLRKVNINDDDLMVVRDTTADEEACQLADDGQETINEIVPRQILVALVHT